MCSVVGYVGKGYSRSHVIEGLSRLEYRGYDSAGFSCFDESVGQILSAKAAGKLSNLIDSLEKNPIDGQVGIGHTRWATHGVSSLENAHPHFDCDKKISLVHNGIIENHDTLKLALLSKKHTFYSNTDTEIVAHLIEGALREHESLKDALMAVVNRLEGSYAFVVMSVDYPGMLMLVRKRSPLCIGAGEGEMFAASDMLAFAGVAEHVSFLPDESIALVRSDSVEMFGFDGAERIAQFQPISVDWNLYEKHGHEHYMLKEIYEQKGAIHNTIDFLSSMHDRTWDEMGVTSKQIKELDRIDLLGCGTSWHAGAIARFFFEQIAQLPVDLHLASEFRYASLFAHPQSIYIAISQSGETADTLEGVRLINKMGLSTVALTNVSSSTMVREAGGALLTQAGREIAVASTKAFSTQLTALYWLAHRIALEKGIIDHRIMEQAQEDLLITAAVLEETIERYKMLITNGLAKQYAAYDKMIFLGRHMSYPFALEASLKLKEIAYILATGYPAGELKHGPLALIDENIPVFVFSSQDEIIYQKLVSNVQEVKARNGHVVSFAFEGQDQLIALSDTVFIIPRVNPLLGPLSMTGLMQYFFYAIAKELDRPIDKPRNLAKSVTVE